MQNVKKWNLFTIGTTKEDRSEKTIEMTELKYGQELCGLNLRVFSSSPFLSYVSSTTLWDFDICTLKTRS